MEDEAGSPGTNPGGENKDRPQVIKAKTDLSAET
jgi:hypothetical protein